MPAPIEFGGPKPASKLKAAPERGAAHPAAPPGNLVQGITDRMRTLILGHELPPGTILLQTEWAERLGVSRTPLREAFRILEGDGLVTVSNGNRTIQVVRYTVDELRDMYEIRSVIDGLAAQLLARSSLRPDVDQSLKDLLERMNVSSRPFVPAEWFSAHTDFHVLIARECGNSRVGGMEVLIRSTCMSLHTAMVRSVELDETSLSRVLDTGNKQHANIYCAIAERDADAAQNTAWLHIEMTLKSGLVELAARRSDDRAV